MMVVLGSVPLKPWRGPGEDGGAADGATSAKSGFRKRPILYSPEMEPAFIGKKPISKLKTDIRTGFGIRL